MIYHRMLEQNLQYKQKSQTNDSKQEALLVRYVQIIYICTRI